MLTVVWAGLPFLSLRLTSWSVTCNPPSFETVRYELASPGGTPTRAADGLHGMVPVDAAFGSQARPRRSKRMYLVVPPGTIVMPRGSIVTGFHVAPVPSACARPRVAAVVKSARPTPRLL